MHVVCCGIKQKKYLREYASNLLLLGYFEKGTKRKHEVKKIRTNVANMKWSRRRLFILKRNAKVVIEKTIDSK